MRVSHGCVRLYPENIELLFSLVERGAPVNIINEPYLAGRRDGEWYFESHTPLEDDAISTEDHLLQVFDITTADAEGSDEPGPFAGKREQDLVRTAASDALGVPVRVLLGDVAEIYERAIFVRNTVEVAPAAPVVAETDEVEDEPLEPVSVAIEVSDSAGSVVNDE
jgi:hypothetical protein